jgi:hypothetical protein
MSTQADENIVMKKSWHSGVCTRPARPTLRNPAVWAPGVGVSANRQPIRQAMRIRRMAMPAGNAALSNFGAIKHVVLIRSLPPCRLDVPEETIRRALP